MRWVHGRRRFNCWNPKNMSSSEAFSEIKKEVYDEIYAYSAKEAAEIYCGILSLGDDKEGFEVAVQEQDPDYTIVETFLISAERITVYHAKKREP